MFHVDFTDVPLWIPFAQSLGLSGSTPIEETHDKLNSLTLKFFEEYLQ